MKSLVNLIQNLKGGSVFRKCIVRKEFYGNSVDASYGKSARERLGTVSR